MESVDADEIEEWSASASRSTLDDAFSGVEVPTPISFSCMRILGALANLLAGLRKCSRKKRAAQTRKRVKLKVRTRSSATRKRRTAQD
jgi:hypothetical protein